MTTTTIKFNDGKECPSIGYGLGTANYSRESTDALLMALKAGYFHWDGAEAYGNDESIGVALAKSGLSRDQFYITGKCSSKDPRVALEKTLKALGTSYVDLYLLHSSEWASELGLQACWAICEEMQKEGLCRSIGVSNYRIKDLALTLETAKVTPVLNQIELHPYNYAASVDLISYCQSHHIVVSAYGGLTSLTKQPGGAVDSVVGQIASETGHTESQVLLKWNSQVTKGVVITTSSKLERLQEQLGGLDMPDLSDDQIKAIVTAGSTKHFRAFMDYMDEE